MRRPPPPSVDKNTQALPFWTRLRQEAIVGEINVSLLERVEELELVSPEDRREREVQLGFGQTMHTNTSASTISADLWARWRRGLGEGRRIYFMPMHCRLPLEKETM